MPLPKIKLKVLSIALQQDASDCVRRDSLREEVLCAIEDINMFDDDVMQRIEVGGNKHVFLHEVSQGAVYLLKAYPKITVDPKERAIG